MKSNFICKAFLLTAALFATSFAKETIEEEYVLEKNEYSNTATFIGGPVDGIIEDEHNTCEADLSSISQYAVVSEKVFEIDDVCKNNYVVALATPNENLGEFPLVKARIVESSESCNDAQVILNKETYDKISKNEIKADIIWAVVDDEGNIKVKVNYEAFDALDENVGIPAEELERLFEEAAKKMVAEDIDAQSYPWDTLEEQSSGNDHTIIAAFSVAAVAGLICFAGYKVKPREIDTSDNLRMPDIDPNDSCINSISDHPEGLPRIDIYNPPLEFYHFQMDTSYDIVDIRPEFHDYDEE